MNQALVNLIKNDEGQNLSRKTLPACLTEQSSDLIREAILTIGQFDEPIIRQVAQLQIAEEQAYLAQLIKERNSNNNTMNLDFNTLQSTRDAVLITDKRNEDLT